MRRILHQMAWSENMVCFRIISCDFHASPYLSPSLLPFLPPSLSLPPSFPPPSFPPSLPPSVTRLLFWHHPFVESFAYECTVRASRRHRRNTCWTVFFRCLSLRRHELVTRWKYQYSVFLVPNSCCEKSIELTVMAKQENELSKLIAREKSVLPRCPSSQARLCCSTALPLEHQAEARAAHTCFCCRICYRELDPPPQDRRKSKEANTPVSCCQHCPVFTEPLDFSV